MYTTTKSLVQSIFLAPPSLFCLFVALLLPALCCGSLLVQRINRMLSPLQSAARAFTTAAPLEALQLRHDAPQQSHSFSFLLSCLCASAPFTIFFFLLSFGGSCCLLVLLLYVPAHLQESPQFVSCSFFAKFPQAILFLFHIAFFICSLRSVEEVKGQDAPPKMSANLKTTTKKVKELKSSKVL